MMLPKLYKYTTKGQVQEWAIICPPDENYYYTQEGIKDGKLTTSLPTYCMGKNIGKSNETTDSEQAVLEAKAKWQKKKDKGYNEILTSEKNFFEPMLAFEMKQYEKLLFTVPTFIQPKLDGVRCILQNYSLNTRQGKPIVSCPHISVDGSFLDGELYNHELKNDFNKIISLTRKSKPDLEDLAESKEKIQYWVYDNPSINAVFSERIENLRDMNFPDCFKLVPTYQIQSMVELQEYHAAFVEQGFEGSIIRLDLGPYENKRSKQLLKYKDFQDAEFKIVDITPGLGNRANAAGRLICELSNGETFGCSMTGTVEFMERVLRDKNQIIGLEATVKYFELTPDGVPRFPTLKCIIGYV